MMNYYEQKFWDEYKKELVAPIELLIQNKYDNAAAKLILSGIDNLAGYYTGRIGSGKIGSSLAKSIILRFILSFAGLLRHFFVGETSTSRLQKNSSQ